MFGCLSYPNTSYMELSIFDSSAGAQIYRHLIKEWSLLIAGAELFSISLITCLFSAAPFFPAALICCPPPQPYCHFHEKWVFHRPHDTIAGINRGEWGYWMLGGGCRN